VPPTGSRHTGVGVGSVWFLELPISLRADRYSLVRFDFDFQDSEGRWTPEKRRRVTQQINERLRADGIIGEPKITFEEPERLPSPDDEPRFAYCYSAEIDE
jgi:hypothetical protein